MPVTLVPPTIRRAAARIGLVAAVAAVAAMAYVAGVVPAPARVAVDHCYVTYDRLERQLSRCVGRWTRIGGVTGSGPVHGVPVSTQWQVLTTAPDENFEWEVSIPETSRHYTALTAPTIAWVIPWPMQVLWAIVAVTAVGYLVGTTVSRARRRSIDR
ncbi:hypothetical protein [Micromonospora sp. NPDC051296]|uniref:hypothetical protein n=1 Tax=Micromonospora sp. NPDC051296 TaxID=3155046 RepID=UPI0034390D2A